MTKKLFLATIVALSTLFISCQKEEPIRCILPYSTTISNSNTNFFTGETISLKAQDYQYSGSDIIYKWSGPNGFYSELQNPTIANATVNMTGEYKLKVVRGICESPEASVKIEVIDNTEVLCNPNPNNLTFSSLFSNFTFGNNVLKTTRTGDYNFTFEGYDYSHGIGIDIDFATLNKQKPNTGIYSIVSKTTNLDFNSVHMNIKYYNVFSSNTTYYYAKSGKVKITYINDKMLVIFCSVPFSKETTTDFNASSNLSEY
jgi:hypothetical protein